jgi:hypothetical protein
MQLDDLKTTWAAHDSKLERCLAFNEQLLRERVLSKARLALAPYVAYRALEFALGVAALFAIVPVFAKHAADPRYFVAVGTLTVFSTWLTALCAFLLVKSLGLDFGTPVAVLQRQFESLKRIEYRAFKWALLGGTFLWLPFLLVTFEALTGVDALARVDFTFLVANLVFGGLVLAGGLAWSRRYVERPDSPPWARRVVDALAGRSLRNVSERLAELERFGGEERT